MICLENHIFYIPFDNLYIACHLIRCRAFDIRQCICSSQLFIGRCAELMIRQQLYIAELFQFGAKFSDFAQFFFRVIESRNDGGSNDKLKFVLQLIGRQQVLFD